jgi:uncharacterized membrane protein YsdA (DUF1294 family)
LGVPQEFLLPLAVLAAYAVMSCITLMAFTLDKRAARLGKWRTPEKNLLMLAAAMGVAGAWMGVLWVRHKSRHSAFILWLILITAAHLLAWAGYVYAMWVR